MPGPWTKLTISVEVRDLLAEECRRLARAHEAGHTDTAGYAEREGSQPGCGVSADVLLRRMLGQRRRHRLRRAEARARARERRTGK